MPVDIAPFTDHQLLLTLTPHLQVVEWWLECLYLQTPDLSRRQFAPHSSCIIARVVFEEGKVGGGVWERGSRGGALLSWQLHKSSQACLQLCVGGKRQVGLLGFCSLPLWHSWEKARTRTGGSWVWGPRGAWCDILPCFTCSESLSALLGAVLGKASTEPRQGGKGEAKEKGGGDKAARGQRVSCPPLRARGDRSMCRV